MWSILSTSFLPKGGKLWKCTYKTQRNKTDYALKWHLSFISSEMYWQDKKEKKTFVKQDGYF